MRTITAIEVQRGNQQRLNVHLDGCFAFGLDVALAMKANLSVGQPLTDEDLGQFVLQDEVQRCYDAALRFLGCRPRSVAEVRRKLRGRGFPVEVVDDVIQRLDEQRLVDDAAFAMFWLENRQTFKPSGERLLRLELRGKGIDAETVQEMLDDQDDAEAAYRAGQKKARLLANYNEGQFRQRLGYFLQRRGFGYEDVNKVVDRLWREREGGEQ